jgi:MoxR-like ATPase
MRVTGSTGAFYRACEAFVTRCLAADDSLFTPGARIWTADAAEDLYARFVDAPDLRTGVGFIAKLRGQLEGAEPETMQFAAEAVFVHLLGEADTGASKKRTHVDTILSWHPGGVTVPPELDAAFTDGIASIGVAKSRRDRQMNFLLEFTRTWKNLDSQERGDYLDDPHAFARLVRSLPTHSASTEIDGLLHKVFPDTFEPIFSGSVKRRIVAAFAVVAGVEADGDVDSVLAALRAQLDPVLGTAFEFYDPLPEAVWKAPNPAWDDFTHWASRLYAYPGFDAAERDYKLEIAARVGAARAAFHQSGDEWVERLATALVREQNLVPWQTASRFVAWARSDPSRARALTETLWRDSEGLPDLGAFARLAPSDVLGTLSARLAIGSFLLLGIDPATYPIYRPRAYAKASRLVGDPVDAETGEDPVVYDGFIRFLDELLVRMIGQGAPIRDRLDAQSLIWWLGGDEDPPAEWSDDDRRSFIAYRTGGSDEPPPPPPPPPAKAWLVRGKVAGYSLVSGWVDEGFVSIGWDELGDLDPTLSREELLDLLVSAYPDDSAGGRSAALGNLTRFLRLMGVGHLVVTVDGDDLFIGRITGEPSWESGAGSGERRRRAVEWLNADAPVKRAQIRVDAPSLYSRLRTLLTVTDLGEDVDVVAALVGLAPQPPEPPAEATLPPATDELAESVFLTRAWLDDVLGLLREKRQLIFYGPPGTGKTYVAQALAAHVLDAGGDIEIVQFHPSYAYEDFFEGYRPTGTGDSGGLAFDLRPGPLRRLAAEAEADPSRPYLLIVDEINRGNLAKVFGELYFLLEYRDRGISLQYSPEVEFRLPPNLFIIGTMNTADRSIALVDSALRRRFYFVSFAPSEQPFDDVLPRWLAEHNLDGEPTDLLTELNTMLTSEPGIGDEFAVGPSYFMTGDGTPPNLDHVWRYAILPLLEERFYGLKSRAEVEAEFGLATLRRRLRQADADEAGDDDEPAG